MFHLLRRLDRNRVQSLNCIDSSNETFFFYKKGRIWQQVFSAAVFLSGCILLSRALNAWGEVFLNSWSSFASNQMPAQFSVYVNVVEVQTFQVFTAIRTGFEHKSI